MIQTNHTLEVSRSNYPRISRNPVRIFSFATIAANNGGLVRIAEAFLVERLYLASEPAKGPCVGTQKWQPVITGLPELYKGLMYAKGEGFTLVAVEQTNESSFIHETTLPEKVALIIGNEGSGIPEAALSICDTAVQIEQQGFVKSLNVVSATSIALYQWATLWRPYGYENGRNPRNGSAKRVGNPNK